MENPAISIIVPVYNAERYLKRCVESVINQTFKDWEMILVDDGSTDRSLVICSEYGCDYQNISVIKVNRGG